MGRLQFSFGALLAIAMVVAIGCSSDGGNKGASRGVAAEVLQSDLVSEVDSLAYIVGMNVYEQLVKMDSTINVSVVCRAIMEQSKQSAIMSRDQAREEYLYYLLHVEPERQRSYEEKMLSDLASSDRDFTRTKSGLTYHIEVIGDESLTPKNQNDWVTVRYSISRVGGEQVVVDHTESEGLNDLISGVSESVKLIGKGGKIKAWMPSKIAFGEVGDEEWAIEPMETLFYTIELVDMERGKTSERKKERDERAFNGEIE